VTALATSPPGQASPDQCPPEQAARGQAAPGQATGTPATRGVMSLFGPAAAANLVASGLGVLWWVVAARQYSPADLGIAGATIAAATGIGTAATGGLYQVLLRVLPSTRHPRRILWQAHAATAAIAATIGALVGAVGLVAGSLPLPPVTLAVAAALWAAFAMQDAVLLALRVPSTLFVSNVANAVAKLALVVALAGTANGIVWSWLLPLAVLVPIIGAVSLRLADRLTPSAGHDDDGDRRAATDGRPRVRHVGAEYVSSLCTLAVTAGVPVLVVSLANPTLAGLAVTTWALFVAAEAASSILAGSVVVTVSSGHRNLHGALRPLAWAILPVGAAIVAAVALAPVILAAFGPAYAAATGMLRVLVLAMLVRLAAHLAHAVLRLAGRLQRLVAAQAAFAGFTLTGIAIAASSGNLTAAGLATLAGATAGAAIALPAGVTSLTTNGSSRRLRTG
jgi:O-antigen/teichoic acid export membrane protein